VQCSVTQQLPAGIRNQQQLLLVSLALRLHTSQQLCQKLLLTV
jgi:hypothetical protein